MSGNRNLHAARRAQDDEFYTTRETIEAELVHYHEDFRGKSILCNCDDPESSEFVKYFVRQFDYLGLKKLVATHYDPNEENPSYFITYFNDVNDDGVIDFSDAHLQELRSNGDFRSADCLKLLDDCDIVVTNPPFSKFREFMDVLMEHGKQFLIIGNQNVYTYLNVFKYFMDGRVWVGYNYGDMAFRVPSYYPPRATRYWEDETGQKWRSMGNACWLTNLPSARYRGHVDVEGNYYDVDKYPDYDNYKAIEVSRVDRIPCDYEGLMGVPITFLNRYDPRQFEIVGTSANGVVPDEYKLPWPKPHNNPFIKGKAIYQRIFIRHKRPDRKGDA